MDALFSVFGMKVTAYSLGIAAAAAAAIGFLAWRCGKTGLRAGTWDVLAILALPLGLLGARVFYCGALIQRYMQDLGGVAGILRLWKGGYSMWGALGGAVLAGVITARLTRQKTAPVLDALAPSLALFTALERFSEYFDSSIGYGLPIPLSLFQRFPFAEYRARKGGWVLEVCLLEGLAALIILAVLLRKKRREGDTARLFFTLYGVCQIVLESLRRDSYPRWLFVRVYQVTAVVVVLLLMIAAVVRWALNHSENRMKVGKLLALWAVFILLVGIVIAMEFSIDGKILAALPVWGAYGIMALCCVGMGMVSCQVIFSKE